MKIHGRIKAKHRPALAAGPIKDGAQASMQLVPADQTLLAPPPVKKRKIWNKGRRP